MTRYWEIYIKFIKITHNIIKGDNSGKESTYPKPNVEEEFNNSI